MSAGDGAPVATRQVWLADARDRLGARLDEVLGDRFRLDGRRRPARADRLVVTDHDLTHRCVGRFAHPDGDRSLPAATTLLTRALGKVALGDWDGVELPVRALDRVLESITEPEWILNALDDLDPAARSAVRASTEAWIADVLTSVRGRSDLRWLVGRIHVDLPGRSVRLTAACDARLGERLRPTTLLVHAGRLPDDHLDRVVAGFTALVTCFWVQAVPERVRCSTAGTGSTRSVTVTPEVLDLAVDRIVELVAAAADPGAAPLSAGGWCRWCHRLAECGAGRAHLGEPS